METAEKHILEIDSVGCTFGVRRILSGVYLAIETGCVTALLGRNGSGKSCLMKILCGSLRVDFRSMRIDGKWHERFGCDQVRYLPQHPFVPGWLTIGRTLQDFGLQRDDLVARFPLFARLGDTRIRCLSGGERRLLECYLILRSRSQFVLLDEPFSQVAPVHVETLNRLIVEEKQTKGILLTDHLYRQVAEVADRLYVLADGHTYRIEDREELVRLGYLNPNYLP